MSSKNPDASAAGGERNDRRAGAADAPSSLPPDLQQANVSNVKKLEEEVAPIQQYREGRRRKKPATKPH